LRQRIQYATICLTEEGRERDILAGEGCLPGDHVGPRLFLNSYNGAVQAALDVQKVTSFNAKCLFLCCPLTGVSTQIGCTFVDDVGNKVLGRTPHQLVEEAQWEAISINESLDDLGIELNMGKEENVIEGPSTLWLAWLHRHVELFAGRIVSDAKYLRGRHVQGMAFAPERQRRLRAMRLG